MLVAWPSGKISEAALLVDWHAFRYLARPGDVEGSGIARSLECTSRSPVVRPLENSIQTTLGLLSLIPIFSPFDASSHLLSFLGRGLCTVSHSINDPSDLDYNCGIPGAMQPVDYVVSVLRKAIT